MKQDIEVASRIEREKIIQELHVAYKIHKDVKHYIISSAAIQKYAVPLFKAGAEWQSRQMAWISVNDKLPEDGHIIDDLTIYSHTKNVIVLYKNGCIGKGKRIYVNEINKKGWQWSCLKGEDITPVSYTHLTLPTNREVSKKLKLLKVFFSNSSFRMFLSVTFSYIQTGYRTAITIIIIFFHILKPYLL